MPPDWKKDVFRHKNLWEVYKDSIKIQRRSGNVIIFWVFFIFISSTLIGISFVDRGFYSLADSAMFVHDAANFGVSLSLSILGFLVAGFAIFASVTKIDLFVMLAQIPYKIDSTETGLSRLQYIFFNFLNVFVLYIVLLSMCAFITLGFSKNSPLLFFSNALSADFPNTAFGVNLIVSGLILVIIVESILRLKSFIWNMYQAVMLAIATEAELKEHHEKSSN